MSHSHRILIIDEVHPVLLEKLVGFDVLYKPDIEESDLVAEMANATILLVRSKLIITKEWIDRAPHLQLIGRLGSGMDNIDLRYAAQQNITCVNAPEGNRNAVAEQAVGMLLSLLTHIQTSALEVKKGVWDRKKKSRNRTQRINRRYCGIWKRWF